MPINSDGTVQHMFINIAKQRKQLRLSNVPTTSKENYVSDNNHIRKTPMFSCVTKLVILVFVLARSPDLMSLNCFLWGHMKDVVYWQKLQTRELLLWVLESTDCTRGHDKIFRKAMNYILRHAELWIQNGGDHLEQLPV
jgi:hypothetical protein